MRRTKIPSAKDLMTRQLHTVGADDALQDAVQGLLKKGHSGAPVVDSSGTLVGVLSEHDCVAALAQAAADRWPLGRVSQHMTRDVETVSPSDDVFAVASRFSQGRHRRLIVEEGGELVGIISRTDLLRALAALEADVSRSPHETTYETIEKRHRALD